MRTRALCACAAALWFALPATGLAQVRVDALTEVRRIRLSGVHELPEHQVRAVVKTKDRGAAYGLRAALGKLPLVPGPGHHPFSPIELQQDVVRIRGLYLSSGFPRTNVRYQVERDDPHNLLDITFVITEGRPLILAEVSVIAADSLVALPIAETDRASWDQLTQSVIKQQGHRLDVEDAGANRKRLVDWWRNRGYPRATVVPGFAADSARSEGRLAYRVSPGPVARLGEVRVEGNESLSEATLRNQAAIKTGAPYSAAALEEARLGLQALDIVRSATVDARPPGARDSSAAGDSTLAIEPGATLPVTIRITEAERRLVSGELGYVTDAGLSSEARWTHRNFTGGGRVFTLTGLAQTGWLAITTSPDERYRGTVSLKQPAVFNRRGSLVFAPFVDHRNDEQDRSLQYGLNTTLVYQIRQLQSVSLDYQISQKHVYEYRFGDLASGEIDLLTFLTQVAQGQLTTAGSNINLSSFTLSGALGRLDDATNPRKGVVVRPAVQVTAPTSLSSTAYWRLDATGNGFLPLGRRSMFAVRAAFGRLLPYGKSIPAPGEDPSTKLLQLRDASFTTGGTGEVRGWEDRLLGPKVPNILFSEVNGALVPRAEGYAPVGGFARALFSAELRLPFPWLGKNFGSRLFLDGGRVWTDDARFGAQGDPNGQEKLFVATGTGIDLKTPVGPIEASIAYKLNPSITDLVDASDMLAGVQQGIPLDQLKRRNGRRWQFHLAIGTSF